MSRPPDYFSTIGQPVLAGRAFMPADRGLASDNPVVIVNQTMARHYWPDQDPIGKRISGDDDHLVHHRRRGRRHAPAAERAGARRGVPADAADRPAVARPGCFAPTWIRARWSGRFETPCTRSIPSSRSIISGRLRKCARRRSRRTALTAALLGLFALLALVITAAGIAGVVAFSVNQRTQEFGIRMALGAQRASVLRMVLRQGITLVLTGLAIGMAGAVVLTRVLTTHALRRAAHRRAHVPGRVDGAGRRRGGRLPDSGAPRRVGRSDGGVAGWLKGRADGTRESTGPSGGEGRRRDHVRGTAPPSESDGGGAPRALRKRHGDDRHPHWPFWAWRPPSVGWAGQTGARRSARWCGSGAAGSGEGSRRARPTCRRARPVRVSLLVARDQGDLRGRPARYEIQMRRPCARMGKAARVNARPTTRVDGKIYIFGTDDCHKKFVAIPAKFLATPVPPMPSGAP